MMMDLSFMANLIIPLRRKDCQNEENSKIRHHICAGMYSSGFSGAYCITFLVMSDGASERSQYEQECRLRTKSGLLMRKGKSS
jgi:hypothetical protein